jgi:hypothetical protein
MFGMLWIDVYDNALQFPAISRNFTQPLEEEWDNNRQATVNSMRRR